MACYSIRPRTHGTGLALPTESHVYELDVEGKKYRTVVFTTVVDVRVDAAVTWQQEPWMPYFTENKDFTGFPPSGFVLHLCIYLLYKHLELIHPCLLLHHASCSLHDFATG